MDIDLSIALVGLPNVGKSIIFNLLTDQRSEVSPYPISTPKPLYGVVEWTDPRMPLLAKVIHPEQVFPLKLQITDTVGIMPGQNQGMSGNAEGLESMRSSDILCHVVRSFKDQKVAHIRPDLDLARDSNIFWTELCLIDYELIKSKAAKLERTITRGSKDPSVHFENDLLNNKILLDLRNGIPLCEHHWDEREVKVFDSLTLVTHKPNFIVLNYDENQIEEYGSESKWKKGPPFQNKNVLASCSRLETDITNLSSIEQAEFLSLYDGFSLTSQQIIPMALNTANRITYFTFGHLGLKQWSVPKDTTSVDAARRLHTDFANRFVAVEVAAVDALLETGSIDLLKSQGKLRLEGRDYIVKDGDILYFRFSK